MPIMATAKRGDGSVHYEPAPDGVHQGVCVDVEDLGDVKVTWLGVEKIKHMIRVVWQITESLADGRPYSVTKRYNLSLHEKSTLRKDLEAWRGKPFTYDEEAGFDVEKLIGVNCLLNVQRRTPQGSDRVYANVMSIMPLVKGMPKIEARDFVRKKDRTEAQAAAAAAVDDDEDVIPF